MTRTLDINKIKTSADNIIDDAAQLISSLHGEISWEIIEIYQFMAENCRNYYNEFNLKEYVTRASVYATSALELCEAHGTRTAQSAKNKLRNTVNGLMQFTQNTWYHAQDAGKEAQSKELTGQQKDFIHEAAELITEGIGVAAILGTAVTMNVTMAIISTSIMSSVVVLGSPILMTLGTAAAVLPAFIPLITFMTAPVIYSVYNEICEFKDKNPKQNLTAAKLFDIMTQDYHFAQGSKLIEDKLQSAIKNLNENIEQSLESGFKKALVAKEMTKSMGKDLSQTVSDSKVGKGVSKAKDIVQRSAGKVKDGVRNVAGTVKAKFTEKLDSAREGVTTSNQKR